MCQDITKLFRFISLALAPLMAFGQRSAPGDLTQANLEDLMNIQVTSVSRKEQALSKAGAAIFVITREDIRRSGAANIPDILRMAPGVTVARISNGTWAISMRGFNDQFADKVLVLIDGRSVYNPTFAGVQWDTVDLPLENIERIELIRGPGGTVWGANAMNGVINIITRHSKDTKGTLISAAAGSELQADALVQYGGNIGRSGNYRVYGKLSRIDTSDLPNGEGSDGGDAVHLNHAGFRSDWDFGSDKLMVQGDLLRIKKGQIYSGISIPGQASPLSADDPVDSTNSSITAAWTHTLASGSAMSLQVYDTYSRRLDEGNLDRMNTVDVDFQHHLAVGSRQDVVWAAGYRVTKGNFRPSAKVSVTPQFRTEQLLSTFVQDEVKLASSLSLTLGSKFEHNSYTGFEFEPSAQLVWTPTTRQAVWASAARAIRQPTIVDTGLRADVGTVPLPQEPPAVLRAIGNPFMKAESVNDFEAGYRVQASKRLLLDLATFSSYYKKLRTTEQGLPFFSSTGLIFPLYFGNDAHGQTYGGEIFVSWNATHRWRISPGYSYLHMTTDVNSAAATTLDQTTGQNPKHQIQVRSSLTLPHHLEWDLDISHISSLATGPIPAYTAVNSRVGWRMGESVEFSVVGQNLLSPRHAEFPDAYGLSHTLVERAVYTKVTWRF